MANNYLEECKKWYQDTRMKYVEHQYDQSKELDKILFAVSSGAFTVSFAFISQIVITPKKDLSYLIITSWSLLLLSIILSIISYLIVFYDYKEEIKILDQKYKSLDCRELEIIYRNKYKGIPEIINIITIATLIIGLISFLLYVGFSIS